MKLKMFNVLCLALLLLLSSCRQQVTELRIGIIKPSVNHFPLSYALEKGWLDKNKYIAVPFTTGWEAQEALISGRIDMAILPFTYVWNAVSKGYPVKTVSFFERETDAILTQPEISHKQELQGKKVGLLKGSSLDVLWQDFAAKENITCEAVYFRTPNEVMSALQAREIAAAVLYVPLVDKLSADFHVMHWFGDRYPGHPCCNLAINTSRVTSAKEKLMQDFYSELQSIFTQIDTKDKEVQDHLMLKYDLASFQIKGVLQHTRFRMGIDKSGKEFEREMAKISLASDYIDNIPSDEDVYMDIDER